MPAAGEVVLVKCTSNGGHPVVGDAVNPAVTCPLPVIACSRNKIKNSRVRFFICAKVGQCPTSFLIRYLLTVTMLTNLDFYSNIT